MAQVNTNGDTANEAATTNWPQQVNHDNADEAERGNPEPQPEPYLPDIDNTSLAKARRR